MSFREGNLLINVKKCGLSNLKVHVDKSTMQTHKALVPKRRIQNTRSPDIEDIQMFGVNMTFISSSEVKKCIFHECRRHE